MRSFVFLSLVMSAAAQTGLVTIKSGQIDERGAITLADNFNSGQTLVTSAGMNTTLTKNSSRIQQLRGTLTQGFILPDATTLILGWTYEFNNNSTGLLTVYENDGVTVAGTVPSLGYARVSASSVSTTNGTWDVHYLVSTSAPAHNVFGNNTGSAAAPAMVRLACADLSNAGSGCTSAGNAAALFTRTDYSGNTTARQVNVIYQNTTGHELWVIATCFRSGGPWTMTAVSDSSATPTTVQAAKISQGTYSSPIMFLVANNNYYEIQATSGSGMTQNAWNEWQVLTGTFSGGTDVHGSRAVGSTYQNTSGNTMIVFINATSAQNDTWVGDSDSNASPTSQTWFESFQGTGNNTAYFIVPNNFYYKVTSSGSPTLVTWREYQWTVATTQSSNYLPSGGTALRSFRVQSSTYPIGSQYLRPSSQPLFVFVTSSNNNTNSTYAFSDPNQVFPVNVQTEYSSAGGNRTVFVIATSGDFYGAWGDGTTISNQAWYEYTIGP